MQHAVVAMHALIKIEGLMDRAIWVDDAPLE